MYVYIKQVIRTRRKFKWQTKRLILYNISSYEKKRNNKKIKQIVGK